MTLVYISFISHMSLHETPGQKQIEMMNEIILVGICYHFILFANPIWGDNMRDTIGTSVVGFVLGLLAINTLIIIGVNIQLISRKLYLRKIKKQAQKQRMEKLKSMTNGEVQQQESGESVKKKILGSTTYTNQADNIPIKIKDSDSDKGEDL